MLIPTDGKAVTPMAMTAAASFKPNQSRQIIPYTMAGTVSPTVNRFSATLL